MDNDFDESIQLYEYILNINNIYISINKPKKRWYMYCLDFRFLIITNIILFIIIIVQAIFLFN
jgi:hypothetical protein